MTHAFRRPCIIASSARSGSKLLRELLMQSGDFVCYPYDVNYVWMNGHYHLEHDELKVQDVSSTSVRYVTKYFQKLLRKNGNADKRILEKTVSNSLRLDYVLDVFPNAQIVHLIRDGREATISIANCWAEPAYSERNQSLKLQFKKLWNFPFFSSRLYLFKYLKNNFPKLLGRKVVRSWGPRFNGIDQMVNELSLAEVCANQWAKSVDSTVKTLSGLEENQDYIEIKYEDLVSSPDKVVGRLCSFLKLEAKTQMEVWALENIQTSISKWPKAIDGAEIPIVLPILEPNLILYGYVEPRAKNK